MRLLEEVLSIVLLLPVLLRTNMIDHNTRQQSSSSQKSREETVLRPERPAIVGYTPTQTPLAVTTTGDRVHVFAVTGKLVPRAPSLVPGHSMGGGNSTPAQDPARDEFGSPVPNTSAFETQPTAADAHTVPTSTAVNESNADDYETVDTHDESAHDKVAETAKWAFELIPWYDENNHDAVDTLRSVIAGIDIDTRDDFGNTLLMMAVHNSKTSLVKWAIGEGADVNAVNFAGVCALHICCHESSVNREMVDVLLSNGAGTETPDSNGCTVLHYAASAGDAKLVDLLLRYHASSTATDAQGFTAIEYAFESGSERCTAMLMDAEERQREKDRRQPSEAGQTAAVAQEGDWVEYIDHMSGHAYYFNKTTKLTSWERPFGYDMTFAGAERELSHDAAAKKDKKERKERKKKKKKKKEPKERRRKEQEDGDAAGTAGGTANADTPKSPLVLSDDEDKPSSDSDTDTHIADIVKQNTTHDPHEETSSTKDSKKARKKSRRKQREDKTTDASDNDEGKKSEGKSHLLDIWRRVAWKEGIRRVSQKRRRQALQAQREHMRLQQEQMRLQQEEMQRQMQSQLEEMRMHQEQAHEQIRSMHEEESARAKRLAEEADRHKHESNSMREALEEAKRQQAIELALKEKLSAETNAAERKILQELAEKHKAEAEEWQRQHAEEQKVREAAEEARKEYNEKMNILGNIRVFARIRPLIGLERKRGARVILRSEKLEKHDTVTVDNIEKGRTRTFPFDKVYGAEATQEEVYAGAEPLLQSALDGLNVCLFAYGQTGSGKTFTMNGEREPREKRGLMPRTFDLIFEKIAEEQLQDVEVRMFMLEIYLDKLIDLFKRDEDGEEKIVIRKNKYGTVMPTGINVRKATSPADLLAHFDEGIRKRKVTSTHMNAESSRSHLVVSIILKLTDKRTGDESEGKITLVDLAGCERVKKSGAEAQALKEAQSINTSLSALGNVVSAVLAGSKHIPYRSNILTLLMSDTVGGSAKAQMFVNLSPADDNAEESENSMVFAQRVKQIKNQSDAERLAEAQKLKLQKQVLELQRQLAERG